MRISFEKIESRMSENLMRDGGSDLFLRMQIVSKERNSPDCGVVSSFNAFGNFSLLESLCFISSDSKCEFAGTLR
jgi:hypothetical protein